MSCWFYDSEEEHRFDSFLKVKGGMEYILKVSNFENIEDESLMSGEKVNRLLYI